MHRDRRGRHPEAVGLLLLALLFAAQASRAGLFFQPVPVLEGADASSLATDGTNTWAGTVRGVWLLSAGAWSLDGLSDRTVTSVAFAQGAAWAATDGGLYRRAGPGAWGRESFSIADAQVAVLLADGDTLWAGGGGLFRRSSGGAWTALPSYGPGFVTALGTWNGSLVAGLSFGGAVRWDAATSSWAPLWNGLGAGDAPLAFAVDAGSLVAGLARGLFTWTGAAWQQSEPFGIHDVRSLSTFGGGLRAATNDGGVLRRSGTAWVPENGGLVAPGARAFAVRGADLLLATAGGPISRWTASGWSREGSGLNATIVTSLPVAAALDCWAPSGGIGVATAGAGFRVIPAPGGNACPVVPTGLDLPEGCGNASSAALGPIPPVPTYVAAVSTNCGVWLSRSVSGAFVTTGLAKGVSIGPLEPTPNGLAGGAQDTGVFLFTGSSWSPFGSALPPSTPVVALRQAGAVLWAGTSHGPYRKEPALSDWIPTGTGIPDGWTPSSFAGTDPVFAGSLAGGVFRRDGGSPWVQDLFGLQGQGVYGLAASAGRAWVAAGTAGVEVKSEGAWRPETAGLPPGADVRSLGSWDVREVGSGSSALPASRRLFAGTAGHGLYAASWASAVRSLPVVLDAGSGPLRFRTEVSVGNFGTADRTVRLRFVPAPGFAAPEGPVPEILRTVAAGTELRIPDAIEFLRGAGVPLPAPGPNTPLAGSLGIVCDTAATPGAAVDELAAVARTYAGTPGQGTFGLCYPAPSDLEAAEEAATVFGLRSVPGVSRSNLAVVHVPGRSTLPIALEVQVYAEDGTPAPSLLSLTLAPGEWSQFNGVLEKAGLPSGSFGYARIRRVAGIGPWSAYGVVNDQRTNDGSFLPPYRPGGLAASRHLVVPVVLDVVGAGGLTHYTTELTLANLSPVGTLVDLTYNPAPGFGTAPGIPVVTLSLPARAERTIPDAIQFLRENGVRVPDPAVAGPQGGTLYVDFRTVQNIGIGETVAMARTSTPNPDAAAGGSFGVFYPAAARGGGARTASLVPGLTRDANVRANLAVVHLGGGSSLPMTLTAQLYDAATGSPAGTPLAVTLNPGDWWQWSGVAGTAGLPETTTRFYAIVRRTAGDDTFLAYGVMNDSVTSDGSYVSGVPAESW